MELKQIPTRDEIIKAIKKKKQSKVKIDLNKKYDKPKHEKSISPHRDFQHPTSLVREPRMKNKQAQPTHQVSNTLIDNRCRYWIENRLSQLMMSDNFTTRAGYSFKIDNDDARAGMCFRFTRNGTTIAKIDSNGYLYCSNVFANGVNLLAITNFINDISSNSSVYVKHVELKDGEYVLDVKDISVDNIVIRHSADIDSTLETPLTITNDDDDNSTCSINLAGQTITSDKTNNKLILNNVIEAYTDTWNTKYFVSNALYNYFTSNGGGNVLVFGKNYAPNNCVISTFRYTADASDSNYLAINFHSSNDLIKLWKNAISIQTYDFKQLTSLNSQIWYKLGYQDGNNGCFNILYQYAYNSDDRYTVMGNQGYPALKFWRDKVELLMNMLAGRIDCSSLYINGVAPLTDDSNYAKLNANNTFNGTLNTFKSISSLSNYLELLYSSLNAGYEVVFNFGKTSGNYQAGNLAYHLDSTLANSYISLYLNGMSGLNIYADKTESITPFHCPSLYINGTQFDPSYVAYTNITNTFTADQTIKGDLTLRLGDLGAGQPRYLKYYTRDGNGNLSEANVGYHPDTSWDGSCFKFNVESKDAMEIHKYSIQTSNRFLILDPNASLNLQLEIQLGKDTTNNYNALITRYHHNSDASTNNYTSIGYKGALDLIDLYPNKVNVNGKITINGSTTSTWGENLLDLVKSNLISGEWVRIRLGKEAGGDKVSGYMVYVYNNDVAQRKLAFGHWNGNETLAVFNDRVLVDGKLETTKTTPANAFGNNMKASMLKLMYPVGSIYQNATDDRNPNDIFGVVVGTWTKIQNYYLYCNVDGHTTGPNGGYGGAINHRHGYGISYCGWYNQIRGIDKIDNVLHLENGSWANSSAIGSATIANNSFSGGDGSANQYSTQGNTTNTGSFPPFYRVWTWYRSA